MKKLVLPTILLAAILWSGYAEAQVRLDIGVNIGRPAWGLPGDYVGDYYYLPEIDTYYDIPHRSFIYLSNGRWTMGASLPGIYSDYDLYDGYKVVINESRPWYRGDYYRDRYRDHYMAYRRPVIVDNRYPAYGGGRWDNRRNRDWDDDRNERWEKMRERENKYYEKEREREEKYYEKAQKRYEHDMEHGRGWKYERD